MARIDLEHVSMKFGDFYAVNNINLTIEDGEYVTILGPSGCGKTTLIKTVSGILRPTEGKVLFDGRDVTDVPLEDRDNAYVFQNIALFSNMTNRENAEYSPRVHDIPIPEKRKVAEKYLELVDMLSRAEMFPQELSGGEQQKVAIARALSSGSKTLMLDEPLSALDARVRMELRYEIRRLVKELGITVLHVTHDQEEAMSVSDKIVLMKSGKVHDTASPRDMYDNPKSIFAAYFIGDTNLLEGFIYGRTKKGYTVVHLRGGPFVKAEISNLKQGSPVVISVRPENVHVATDGLGAEVKAKAFLGAYWSIRVLADTGDYINYNISDNFDTPEIGDRVMLVFNKKRTKVFKRPENGLEEAIKLE